MVVHAVGLLIGNCFAVNFEMGFKRHPLRLWAIVQIQVGFGALRGTIFGSREAISYRGYIALAAI